MGVLEVADAEGQQQQNAVHVPFHILQDKTIYYYLEIADTIRGVFNGDGILLDNGSRPTLSVAAKVKKKLQKGDKIDCGLGSFQVRGITIKMQDHAHHVPIGLLYDAVLKKDADADRLLTFDDVEIPESLALRAWNKIQKNAGFVNT